MPEKRKFAVAAAFVALCIIWSSTWLAIKIGLRDLPPISFVALRFVIAVVVLLIAVWYFALGPGAGGTSTNTTNNNNTVNPPAATQEAPASP